MAREESDGSVKEIDVGSGVSREFMANVSWNGF